MEMAAIHAGQIALPGGCPMASIIVTEEAAVVLSAGEQGASRFLEFFAAHIRNPNT
jgi:hypothetical protein